jgi:hypothetical protein
MAEWTVLAALVSPDGTETVEQAVFGVPGAAEAVSAARAHWGGAFVAASLYGPGHEPAAATLGKET